MKRALRVLLVTPLVLFGLLLVTYFVFTHHVAYEIAASARPPASWSQADAGVLTVRYLGVSGYEISDGVTTILTDPTPTRPTPLALITGPVDADPALGAKWCPKADLILVNHAHHDHALDVGAIGLRTGALVAGSQNAVNLALSRGVPKEKTRVVKSGDSFTVGAFTIDVVSSRHAKVTSFLTGPIPADAKPTWFWGYGLDDTFAYRLSAHGTTIWFHPTSTFAPGELHGLTAKTLIVGINGEALTPEKVKLLLAESQPVRVLPTHYDNFFQPLDRGLAKMPMLDVDAPRALFLAEDSELEWGMLDFGQTITLPAD